MAAPHPELAAEQAHVDAAYERLAAMRRSAARVSEAYAEVGRGGTHQARLERDVALDVTRRRLSALDIGDTPLCFGRLDLATPIEEGAGARYYVGRIAVDDESHSPLVVDWRAPVAEPFYRATAIDPMDVVRRRHFAVRGGRQLVGIDDEVFDAAASDAAGLTIVGEGALLSALERDRTGRMGDIVATIQAEQDEAIRAPLSGVLVVAGGPGTGKTAVALHRAAYLLYTHRRRLAGDGVLLVGPGPVFLRYIEQVLPSLGEHEVQLSTVSALKPGVPVRGTDPPDRAALKGDPRLARLVAAAVGDRERPLGRTASVALDGLRLRISRGDSQRIVERVRRRRGTHNARRPQVVRAVTDHLVARYRSELVREYRRGDVGRGGLAPGSPDPVVAGALARGETPPEGWDRQVAARIRALPDVRTTLDRMWPVLTGVELLHDLFGFPALLRSAGAGILDPAEQDALARSRAGSAADAAWTEADLALIDEADALLGSPDTARPRRRPGRGAEAEAVAMAERVVAELGLDGRTTGADLAARFVEPEPARNGDGEPRIFGHVLVDEAQDLTPMQWRMITRRCPSRSMTLVGDFGQASRPGAPSGWDDVLGAIGGRPDHRLVTLSVNYRTPAEIMDVATRLLAVAAPGVEPPRSVRRSGAPPRFVAVASADMLDAVVVATRRALLGGGTVAVIAPDDLHAPLIERLADVGAVADRPEALDAPVGVFGPVDAKGLEFDHVVLVEPAALVSPGPAGLRMLFVALTRATRTLGVVHARPLPEALTDGGQ